MELYNEEDLNKEQKKSKVPIILGVSIVLLTILTIVIVALILYLKSSVMTITLDGANFSQLESMLITENGKTYIPIRKIAPYLKYEAYAGDYKNKSEDKSKCYISNENETVQFILDSNTIIKMQEDSDYQYIELEDKTIQKKEELYTTVEGIESAFNVEIESSPEDKSIQIYTMDYLVNHYAQKNKIEDYDAEFSDKKAIFRDLLVVEENGKCGVIKASTGAAVLETKYEEIKYLPNSSEFLVKSNNKYGIISENAEIKIKIVYEDMKLIDGESGLYLVKNNNLYGVIDREGKKIIETEYNQIGISNYTSFAKNGVENPYVILNELIPVKKNQLWGFFDIKGKKVSDIKYSEIGCTQSKEENSYPALVIPSYKVVVVGKDRKYNIMGIDGKEKAPANILEAIYLKNDVTTGNNTFYMTYNGKIADVEKWLSTVNEKK